MKIPRRNRRITTRRANALAKQKNRIDIQRTRQPVAGRHQSVSDIPKGYAGLVKNLKKRIRVAQVRASLSVNRELIVLYWEIGKSILARQNAEGWGSQVIDRLSQDLHASFPDMKGFSSRNLKYMRAFAEAYPTKPFVQQLAAQIPWFHHCLLLDKIKEHQHRVWYIRQTVQQGWSRNILSLQIETGLHMRQGNAITNFKRTLPPTHSDLAQDALKDPYIFNFLNMEIPAQERRLEKSMLDHIQKLLLEFGKGFAFMGRQVHLEVGDDDYYLDMLFYHVRLHCYVVIEVKTGRFKPEHAGKMNFYLSAVDSIMREAGDKPTIGLLLCNNRNRLTAEYALRDMGKPIGVAEWKTTLAASLPKQIRHNFQEEKNGRKLNH